MLTGKQIVIIGGDARQLEIIRKLLVLDASVTLVGFEQLDDGFVGATKKDMTEIKWDRVDAIVLPVIGTRSDGTVDSIFSDDVITLRAEQLKKTPPHCVVYSGISNDYLDEAIKDSNRI